MKDNKVVQTKILENWYIMDSLLLNGHAKEKIKDAKLFEQYVSLKAAFLHTLHELYGHINYIPEYEREPKSVRTLTEHAVAGAKHAKKLAANIMHKEDVRTALKKRIVQEAETKQVTDMDAFSDNIIKEKFTQIALDNALIGIPVLESKNKAAFDDFKGEMLNEAYKMYRNELVKLARICMKK